MRAASDSGSSFEVATVLRVPFGTPFLTEAVGWHSTDGGSAVGTFPCMAFDDIEISTTSDIGYVVVLSNEACEHCRREAGV